MIGWECGGREPSPPLREIKMPWIMPVYLGAKHTVENAPWLPTSEVFFKIKFVYFLVTLILEMHVLIIKINNFRADLSNILATTATLLPTWLRYFCSPPQPKIA